MIFLIALLAVLFHLAVEFEKHGILTGIQRLIWKVLVVTMLGGLYLLEISR